MILQSDLYLLRFSYISLHVLILTQLPPLKIIAVLGTTRYSSLSIIRTALGSLKETASTQKTSPLNLCADHTAQALLKPEVQVGAR